MAEMTIDREGIVFCSEYHNFYAYKNLRKRIELLLVIFLFLIIHHQLKVNSFPISLILSKRQH